MHAGRQAGGPCRHARRRRDPSCRRLPKGSGGCRRDDETPMLLTRALPPSIDLLDLHRQAPQRYPLLLESSAHGTAQGRWDLLLMAGRESLRLDRDGITRNQDGGIVEGDFLYALDAAWQRERTARDEPRWPFRGGWALL